MKQRIFSLLTLAGLTAALCGCSSPQSLAREEGHGTRKVFEANYDTIWSAAVAAAQMDDFDLLDSNKVKGRISSHLRMGVETFGQNIIIWVHPLGGRDVSVEVKSQRVGPPMLDRSDYEKRILRSIEMILNG